MAELTNEQLNSLSKEALIILVSSLQDQLSVMQEQLSKANASLADNSRQIEFLTQQIMLMNQRHFGRKSEQSNQIEGQLTLFDSFNEAEALESPSVPEPEIQEVVISSYKRARRKGQREADLDGLPARIIEHRLSEEELAERFPKGYKELPEVIYKRLHIIPETFIVDEHHVHVYASKDNTGEIIKAPRPKDLFRNSIATAPLVASIINGKYSNALPLERQSRTFRMNGIKLPANTLANWVIRSSDLYLSRIYDRLHEKIYENKVLHADETPVKVRRIGDQQIKGGKESRMWVYRNNPNLTKKPIILFEWQPSRRADHPRAFLMNFSGILVTDGYQVYHILAKEREDLIVAGCWIHTRRPYAEFIKALQRNENPTEGTIAEEAYRRITEIMQIDNTFDDLSVSDRKKQRQLHLREKVDAYFAWVKMKYEQVTKNSPIGRALAYSINQEPYLRVFLSDGRVPMDNNFAEQAIRPFTLGRKNFVIIDTSKGAQASAILYSLVETAKANHLNPYKYFELLLTELPNHAEDEDPSYLDDLLPWSKRIQKNCLSQINRPKKS